MDGRLEEKRQASRDYFRQPGFARFLALLRQKYEASRSGPRGYIRLPGLTEQERTALDGFYGMYTPARPSDENDSAKYSIPRFEKLLAASRFAMSVPELFAALDGEILLTKGEVEAAEEAEWRKLIRQELALLLDDADSAFRANRFAEPDGFRVSHSAKSGAFRFYRLVEWVEGLGDGTSAGFRTLRALFSAQRDEAVRCLRDCIRALRATVGRYERGDASPEGSPIPSKEEPRLPGSVAFSPLSPLRLPVLAARVTGDAHALDWKYPLGRMFWWGVVFVFGEPGEEFPFPGEQKRPATWDEERETDVPYDDGCGEPVRNGERRGEAKPGETAGGRASSDHPEEPRSLSRALLIREGYRRGGLADDDLSSQVLFFAPGWGGSREERVLTLRQVEKLNPNDWVKLRPSAVYAVENPSVFAVLVDEAAERLAGSAPAEAYPLLICGNGQPSVAVVKLLELLLQPQTSGFSPQAQASKPSSQSSPPAPRPFYYSGDLDLAGLDIARSLQQRFPASFRAWKMDAEWFKRHARQGIPLTPAERGRLVGLATPWDASLPETAAAAGVKLHQELWVEALVQDWLAGLPGE